MDQRTVKEPLHEQTSVYTVESAQLRVVNPQGRQEILLIKSPYTIKSQILKIDAVFNLWTFALWHGSYCIIGHLLPNTLKLYPCQVEDMNNLQGISTRQIFFLATSDSSVNL